VVETSFGNPTCAAYPERANIEVSLDGIDYISLGTFCQDAALDLSVAQVPYAQYVRITDRSIRSNFNATADGYDIDGIIVVNPGCANGPSARLIADAEGGNMTTEETTEINILNNPTQGQFQITAKSGDESDQLMISIFNISGQKIRSEQLSLPANQFTQQMFDISDFSEGIYLLTIDGKFGRENFKIIKQ
jgi:hypothetical protein